MQVSVESPGALERRVSVEVPEQRVAEKIRERLQEIARSVRIDGFRPGRAPARVVERQFGARIRNEVISELLRSSFSEALSSQNLRPVAEPHIDTIKADAGAGLSYTAVFEIYPEIALAPVEALKLDRPRCEITDGDLDKMVGVLREQHKDWTAVSRAAAKGDQVLIDFEGSVNGEKFEGGSTQDFELVLGSGTMLSGFEDGLIGASSGDIRTLDLQFPQTYRNADLAGKPAQFKVTVKAVREAVLPALDEAFFAKFGIEEGGMEAFRKEVRDNMERERDRVQQQRFNSQVLEGIREANTVTIPKALIQTEISRLQQETRRALMMRGLDPAALGDSQNEQLAARAERRVKLGLLMAEIIKQAGITGQPARVREQVERMAASYEHPEALVKWYYEDPRRLQEIEASCLEDEAVNWIASRAQVTDVSVSFDDLMNPGQTAGELTGAGEAALE